MKNLFFLCCAFAVSCLGVDWYTNYTHNDGSLIGYFNFNSGNPQDAVSHRSVAMNGTEVVPGWIPQDGLILDGKGKLQILDSPDWAQRRDFTLAFYARVTDGGDYLILKKGAFGVRLNKAAGTIGLYIRSMQKDIGFPGGKYDSGWHFWALTVEGKNAAFYCDGVKVGSRTLPGPAETCGEPILLGNSGGWGKMTVTGEIKSLHIYSRALSEKEVQSQAAVFAKGNRPEPLNGIEVNLPVGAGNTFHTDDISYEKKENALYFNGTNAFATLPDYPQLRKLNALTIGCWIKPERTMPKSLAEQGYIVSHNAGAHAGWAIGTYYNNGLQAIIVTDKGKFSASAAQALTPNVWQHVAFAWDGAQLQLFVNGIAVGPSVPTQGNLIPLKTRAILGKAADRNGLYYKGAIDELRIYTAGLLPEADADTGKPVTLPASNTDDAPDSRKLPPFRGLEGKAPKHAPLFDFEDLTGWTVTSHHKIANATFVRSQDDRLWGDHTGKVTITLDKVYDPSLRKVTLRPPKPILIREPFDYAELWVSSQNWNQAENRPKITLLFTGADGKGLELDTTSSEHPFIYWSGWSLIMKKLPKPLSLPAKFDGIVISNFSGSKPNVLYLDNLAVFKMPATLPKGITIPTWEEVGIRNADKGIAMPAASSREKSLTPRKSGNAYTFTANSPKITWSYTPVTGTLQDITLTFGSKPPVHPMNNGGFRFAKADGVHILPDDPKLTATLLSCKATGTSVTSEWRWAYDGTPIETTTITLTAQGHTLTCTLASQGGNVREIIFGEATGLQQPIITTIPYWVTRSKGKNNPAILYDKGLLLSEYVDIYAGRSSELIGGSQKINDHTAQLNGGVHYGTKTDGTRNPAFEVFHITASDALEKVLPHIPNPPNPTNDITKDGIWMTTMWYDTMPMNNYFDRSYLRMKMLHDYGIRNLFHRDHQSLSRQYSPKRRGGFESMITEILPDLQGGDAGAIPYFEKCVRELGYRMGLYSNYTLLDPTNPNEMDASKVTLDSNGDPRYGSGDARMFKYAYILECQKRLNALLKKKYTLTCSYPDQFTCRAPWSFTDFDARAPEAGSFNPILRVFAASMMQEKRDFQVALSEGIMQWPLAGYVDSYAQQGSVNDPLFPEFQLREIHTLSNDCGSHISHITSKKPDAINRLLAMTLGNGNIAHIYGFWGGRPPKAMTYDMLKSYYAIVQAQKHYATIPVESIRYHLNGEMLSATEILARDAVAHSQVYTRYANGFEIWANANEKESWQITVNGRNHLLPPNGYYLYGKGMAEGGSELIDGRRVDSLRGDLWLFACGAGKPVDLGFISCKGAYAVRWEKDTLEVIGLPTALDEEIAVALDALPFTPGTKASYTDASGNVIRTGEIRISNGKVLIPMRKDACKVYITR